jgi:hypothetical protein
MKQLINILKIKQWALKKGHGLLYKCQVGSVDVSGPNRFFLLKWIIVQVDGIKLKRRLASLK